MKNNIITKILKLNLTFSILAIAIGLILMTISVINANNYSVDFAEQLVAMKIMKIGVLLILISPLLRIFIELYFFIKEKNNVYILITLLLLIVIGVSAL
jgi:uncharacterized membrane protein